MISLTAFLVGRRVAGAPRRVVGRKRKFCGDLLEGVLRVGQAKLVAEEVRFGRASVGGGCRPGGYVQRGLDELLRFLNQVRDVEHFGRTRPQNEKVTMDYVSDRPDLSMFIAIWRFSALQSGSGDWEGVACVRLSHLPRRSDGPAARAAKLNCFYPRGSTWSHSVQPYTHYSLGSL